MERETLKGPFMRGFNLLAFASFPVKITFTGICIGKYGFGLIKKSKVIKKDISPQSAIG